MPIPVFSLDTLPKEQFDIAIIGTGPGGTAVAERLYDEYPDITIALIERGDLLLTTHFSNVFPGPFDHRGKFIKAYGRNPWEGDFPGGMLLDKFGGRGLVAGSHLRRFYAPDYHLWPSGQWPIQDTELDDYYTQAEEKRRVSLAPSGGAVQTWLHNKLNSFNPQLPPWGADSPENNSDGVSRGYDSSSSRLWARIVDDDMRAEGNPGTKRRLFVVLNAYCTEIKHEHGSRVLALVCRDTRTGHTVHIEAKAYVLAASPIESARLVLNSGLAVKLPAAGRYLAEHLYLRGELCISTPRNMGSLNGPQVNLVIPPAGPGMEQRFQIEIRGGADPGRYDHLILRLTGSAAMDPRPENCVTLSSHCDEYGVPKAHITFSLSSGDQERIRVMHATMTRIAEGLRGTFIQPPALFEAGRSHHESGTLRMGHNSQDSVCDPFGRVHTTNNFYVGDASVFPVPGVANPLLTIAALGYRLADHICSRHFLDNLRLVT